MRSKNGSDELTTLLEEAFPDLETACADLGVSLDEINYETADRLKIAYDEHQIALEYVNEYGCELGNIAYMRKFVRQAQTSTRTALKIVDGLADTDEESEVQNGENGEGAHATYVDLTGLSQSSSDVSLLEGLDLSLAPRSRNVSTRNPLSAPDDMPGHGSEVEGNLIKLFGTDLFPLEAIQAENKAHDSDFFEAGNCMLHGGCTKLSKECQFAVKKESEFAYVTPNPKDEDPETRVRMFNAMKNTAAGAPREGHQICMTEVSKTWNSAEDRTGTKSMNELFFDRDLTRLFRKKPPQKIPAHMSNKRTLLGRALVGDTVKSRMARHHRFPNTTGLGPVGTTKFDPARFKLGQDEHRDLKMDNLKMLMRPLGLRVGGNKTALVKALDDYIIENRMGAGHPESACQVRIRTPKQGSKGASKKSRRTHMAKKQTKLTKRMKA